jgi:hypothetical protein
VFVNVPERQPHILRSLSDLLELRVDQPLRPTASRARTISISSRAHTRTRNAYAQAHGTLFHRCAVAITQKVFQEHFSSSQKRHHTRDVLMHHHLRGGHGSGHQPVLQKHEADVLWFSSTAEGGELDAEGVAALCFMRWSLLTMINTYEYGTTSCALFHGKLAAVSCLRGVRIHSHARNHLDRRRIVSSQSRCMHSVTHTRTHVGLCVTSRQHRALQPR